MRFLRSYEGQIKSFLTLLVIFLAAAIAVSFHLLMTSRSAIFEEVRLRISTVAEAVRSDLGMRALPLPRGDEAILNSAFNQPRFSRVARERDLVSLELLDREGRVLVSSMVGRLGARDSVFSTLGASERRRLEMGTTVLTPLREGEGIADATMIGLLPLPDGSGSLSGMLRVEDHAESLARVDRSLRILSAIQAGGLASLMVLVFLFARWLLAPYRILAATAIQAVPAAAEESLRSPEPDFLVASFQTVLEKLRAQEHELLRLRAGRSLAAGEDLPAESLAASLTSGMIAFDRELTVRLVNPAAVRILGKGRAELEGRPLGDVFPEGNGMARLIRDARDAGAARSREMVPFIRPDGREIHLGVGLSPIRREGEAIGGVICLLSDLTEIRQLQDRVALKENLAHLGEMSAGIAHEFRNSLATISGYARLLGRREDGDVREMASSIAREVRGIGKVVDNFLQFARPVSLSVTEVDLRGLLEDLVREFSLAGEPPSLRIALEGEFPRLRADEALLRQALHNLLRNAAQARDGEGVRATITGALESDETLRLEVSDNGAGIPPEDLPRIFTPFFTTRVDGTGLGLPLVQKAIVSHDGTIEVASQPGVGTRFRIRLPLNGPPADHRAA